MKRYMLFVCVVLSVAKCSAAEKFIDTIRRNDPNNLNHLLVPGFFITPDEKKRYFEMARKITNRTFEELHSLSVNDVFLFIKGTAKIGTAALAAGGFYWYYRGYADIALWNGFNEKGYKTECKDNELSGHYRKGVYVVLGLLSSYLLCSGANDFASILYKRHRLMRHRDALAVEAVIQRLPVCETGDCQRLIPSGATY